MLKPILHNLIIQAQGFVLFLCVITFSSIYAAEKDLNIAKIIEQQPEKIIISIQDDMPLHVHPDGKAFRIRVKIDAPLSVNISYQWLDYQGTSLSAPVFIETKRELELKSPDSKVGYYGLVFKTGDSSFKFPHRQVGETREYGFAIVKKRTDKKRLVDPESAFGIVHAKLDDPNLPAWIKTLTWRTYSPRHWNEQILKRKQLGLIELPLISGYEWETDDTKTLASTKLSALGSRIKKYFVANPDVIYWELGIEENLKKRFRAEYYLDNLEKKVKKFREIADEVNPEIKFIYQVAGLNIKSIDKFAQHTAAKYFDILSLHPYAWPDFVAPEKWLLNYLQSARSKMKQYGLGNVPIWFTEVGVPHQGNYSGGFFGYPKLNRRVSGHSKKDVSSYMIKLHVLALSKDVKKLFWYNYKDRKQGREKVENHFGLVDYWGFPKPAYVAYLNLIDRLNGKQFIKNWQLSNGLNVFEFKGSHETVFIVWCFSECKQKVSGFDLLNEMKIGQWLSVDNIMGIPLYIDKEKNSLTGELIYITIRNPT